MIESSFITGTLALLVSAGFPFWVLDTAVIVAAALAWLVILYIGYRTIGYVRIEFLGHEEADLSKYQQLQGDSPKK